METAENIIVNHLENQKAYFASGQTKPISFRIDQLRKLKQLILKYSTKIDDALWKDLHKSPEESYLTEVSIVTGEIDNHIKHLKQWAKPKRVPTPLHMLPSKSKIIYEPLGVALIISPWNYPFQLLINPLLGAISSGCCAVLKPSPDAPEIVKVMEQIIVECFDPNYITLVHGAKDTNTILLKQHFDIIFFTGSSRVGKIIMKAAAENLTPVVLELGGKSPCIVDADANVKNAAKRIVFGKLINAGQTCIAPDYLFVHASVKDELLSEIVKNIQLVYGENIKESRFYPRIVNGQAMERLTGLMQQGDIYSGGEVDFGEKYISPTIIDNVSADFSVMKEEIFGPILPVMTFESIEETTTYINTNEKPLAFYYFGKSKQATEILGKTTSGGACVNDVIMHITNHHLPFGGVGNSGMGKYHGQESFMAFSNNRAVIYTPSWLNIPIKNNPFKYFNLIKKII